MSVLNKSKITSVEKAHVKSLPHGAIPQALMSYLSEISFNTDWFCFLLKFYCFMKLTSTRWSRFTKKVLLQSDFYLFLTIFQLFIQFLFLKYSSKFSFHIGFLSSTHWHRLLCFGHSDVLSTLMKWCLRSVIHFGNRKTMTLVFNAGVTISVGHRWGFPTCFELFIPVITPINTYPCLPDPKKYIPLLFQWQKYLTEHSCKNTVNDVYRYVAGCPITEL